MSNALYISNILVQKHACAGDYILLLFFCAGDYIFALVTTRVYTIKNYLYTIICPINIYVLCVTKFLKQNEI